MSAGKTKAHTGRSRRSSGAGRRSCGLTGPELVRQEIWAHLAVHHCLTAIIMRLAAQERTDPDRLSFIKVLKHVRRSVIRQSAPTPAQIKQLMVTIAAKVRRKPGNGIRRLREADRSLKRPASKYSFRKAGQVRRPTRRVPAKVLTLHPAAVVPLVRRLDISDRPELAEAGMGGRRRDCRLEVPGSGRRCLVRPRLQGARSRRCNQYKYGDRVKTAAVAEPWSVWDQRAWPPGDVPPLKATAVSYGGSRCRAAQKGPFRAKSRTER